MIISKIMKKIIYSVLFGCALLFSACDDFIDIDPQGVVDEGLAMSEPEKMVNAAYSTLGNDWYNYPFNLWPYGDVSSDDAMKGGSGTTDTNLHHVEIWSSLTASNPDHLDELWYRLYWNVSRINRALIALKNYGEEKLGTELTKQRTAEMKFLRAHNYYKIAQLFYQIPWVDETCTEDLAQEQTRNDVFTHMEIMQMIADDFQEAYEVLPETQSDGGRANKIAAAAYLAKVYLQMAYGDGYEDNLHMNNDFLNKVVQYTGVVKNSAYGYLEDYGDLFLQEYANSKESIFAVQHSDYQSDGTTYGRANWSNMLNGVWGMWSCGWDFQKPTQNFVNAFKTKDGLPMFDDYDKDHNTYPVNGQPNSQKWDPRLFHTVGMPSWPYKYEAEYTLTTGNSRNPSTYGFYTTLKCVTPRSQGETFNGSWQAFPLNDYVLRYADVMLMRAEALIELNQLSEAREIINDVRQRAKNSINKHISYAANQCEIALYPDAGWNQAYARKALRWERRLEMGQEHERYFDLRRWGIASQTLNAFFKSEVKDNYEGQTYAQYYNDAFFTAGKNEYWPIPYNQLFYVPGLYIQNKGY